MDQQVLAAWVSAGAAVVQAVAAAVAIWYSGKLARDAAIREKAADEANARRIEDANAAAAEQRRLDALAHAKAQDLVECRAFNEPLSMAIGFVEQALRQVRRVRDEEQSKAQAHQNDLHNFSVTPGQLLLKEQLPFLIERAKDAESAAVIRAAMVASAPFDGGNFRTALDWLAPADQKIAAMEAAIERLKETIIHPDDE